MSRTDTGTRAREPDESGYVTVTDGLRLYFEVHGEGSTTIVLLPPCPISHAGIWRAQVHFLARHHRSAAAHRCRSLFADGHRPARARGDRSLVTDDGPAPAVGVVVHVVVDAAEVISGSRETGHQLPESDEWFGGTRSLNC